MCRSCLQLQRGRHTWRLAGCRLLLRLLMVVLAWTQAALQVWHKPQYAQLSQSVLQDEEGQHMHDELLLGLMVGVCRLCWEFKHQQIVNKLSSVHRQLRVLRLLLRQVHAAGCLQGCWRATAALACCSAQLCAYRGFLPRSVHVAHGLYPRKGLLLIECSTLDLQQVTAAPPTTQAWLADRYLC